MALFFTGREGTDDDHHHHRPAFVHTFFIIIPEAKVLLDTSYVESLRSSKATPCSRQLLYSWALIIDA